MTINFGNKRVRTRAMIGCAAVLACTAFTTLASAQTAAPTTQATAQDPTQDKVLTPAELQAIRNTLGPNHVSQPIWTGDNYVVMAATRVATGEVELHDRMADLFIVQEGKADVLIGGHIEGNHVTGPGEARGGKIIGGHVQTVSAGGMLWVPAATPHQVTPDTAVPFRYLVVKIAKSK